MTLRFLTAGESHGPALLAILEGMPAGLELSQEILDRELARRQTGTGSGPRMKIEKDSAQILSGVLEGRTIGAPIALFIQNKDHEKWKGKPIPAFTVPRPGHADLTGAIKYAYHDLRPALERASARETAARVAVGAICKHFLAQFGILVAGYVISIGDVVADIQSIPYEQRSSLAELNNVRCPDALAAERMAARIRQIMQERDTLGGILEVIAVGLPAGLGSHVHWDRRLEARLGAAILSIHAIKGVEFGPAFENTRLPGTLVQDGIRLAENHDQIVRLGNRSGGVEGGITNGEPLVVRAAMKPIATTLTPQKSLDLHTKTETLTQYERSDFCPVPRAVPILEAMMSFILADVLSEKLGGDTMEEMMSRFSKLRKPSLSDLNIEGTGHVFWPEEE
jgi:chorismate synthase